MLYHLLNSKIDRSGHTSVCYKKQHMEGKRQLEPYPVVDQKLVDAYVAQLSPMERQTMQIAQEELKSSFCMEKCIGFLKWMEGQ